MKLVGLTGGIATGKSTASSHLASTHHIPIVDADLIARQVVEPNRPAFAAIVKSFGESVLDPETHALDRAKLGEIVFADPAARATLNSITHPLIRVEMLRSVLRAFVCGHDLCILDTPLLFEAGLWRFVSVVVVVYCPEETQKSRLLARDNCTAAAAQSRIDSQMPIEDKRKRADIIIDNSGQGPERARRELDAAVARIRPGRIVNALCWAGLLVPALVTYGGLCAYMQLRQLGTGLSKRVTPQKSE
ncbi:hypothetical protein HKX48_007320 [Thoreauomyces humboldtii]|nr:hypothetical protein HKX48_007320 [Thoreauomyces humboldtii]